MTREQITDREWRLIVALKESYPYRSEGHCCLSCGRTKPESHRLDCEVDRAFNAYNMSEEDR